MQHKLSPSLMCCDLLALRPQLDTFSNHNVEMLHIDVMDGSFVPNFTLGSDLVRQLKKETNIPLDIHLMIEHPEYHLDLFPVGEGDYVSIHYESTRHVQRVLHAVRAKGAHPLLALNPATPIELARDVLDDIDGVLLMTVNPGFAGQRMVPHSIDKIARTRAFLDANGRADAEIQVDGNVNVENGIKMAAAGANIFVLGSSLIRLDTQLGTALDIFRAAISK